MDNRGTLECLGCPFFAIPDIGYDIFVCKKRCKSRFQHIRLHRRSRHVRLLTGGM